MMGRAVPVAVPPTSRRRGEMWAPQDKEAHIHEKKIERKKKREDCERLMHRHLCYFKYSVLQTSWCLYVLPFMVTF